MKYKINEFLKSNNVCIISTNEPYSASVFYVYDESNEALLFISSPKSRHIKLNKICSAAIYSINPIKGVSIQGILLKANETQKSLYLSVYKQARFALKHEIYALKLKYLKYTDNTLMLPKKTELYYE